MKLGGREPGLTTLHAVLPCRGVFEKVNSIEGVSRNGWRMIVKEIAPDLSAVGTTPMEGTVVNRKAQASAKTYVQAELTRVVRKSQGKVDVFSLALFPHAHPRNSDGVYTFVILF